ncbi:response regulator [bacterium]|nr:response regulator [bacterium]
MLSPDKPADCILVVDDNPESLYHLGGILLDVGYEVEFAGDGLSALEWISLKRFDSILLDVRMPVMNGFEVSSHIRRSSLNRETPVIFLTAYNDLGRITGNSGMAGSDYITKPFRKRELLARLRTKVNEGKAGRNFRLYLEEIEASNLYIKQSLEYAVYIQNAIMKSFGEQQESLPEHFILSIPRDIISGDFHCFYRNRG